MTEITQEQAKFLESNFDLNGWNAGGEEITWINKNYIHFSFNPCNLGISGFFWKFGFNLYFLTFDVFSDGRSQLLVISITHEDGRELIFDCDWGLGYYPGANNWKWWGENPP